MGFWFLDDKTQLTLLMAGLLGGAAAACDSTPIAVDPAPRDFRVERRNFDTDPLPRDMRADWRRDGMIADPLPRDMRSDRPAKLDKPIIVDPLPPDMRRDVPKKLDQPIVVDMVPPDMKLDKPKKVDAPIVVDMVPQDMKAQKDAAASWGGTPQRPKQVQPQPGRQLPLARDLRVQIKARATGTELELTATAPGTEERGLSYRWTASGGTLDRTDARVVRWSPPAFRGLHMIQVTARDGDRAISVDIYLHEVR
jgi:hypothetical protein